MECRNILANEIHFTCTQKKKVLDIQKDEGGHLKETRMNRWRTVKGQMLNQKQTNKQKKKKNYNIVFKSKRIYANLKPSPASSVQNTQLKKRKYWFDPPQNTRVYADDSLTAKISYV